MKFVMISVYMLVTVLCTDWMWLWLPIVCDLDGDEFGCVSKFLASVPQLCGFPKSSDAFLALLSAPFCRTEICYLFVAPGFDVGPRDLTFPLAMFGLTSTLGCASFLMLLLSLLSLQLGVLHCVYKELFGQYILDIPLDCKPYTFVARVSFCACHFRRTFALCQRCVCVVFAEFCLNALSPSMP